VLCQGAVAIARALSGQVGLADLNLSNNNIDDDGALAIARVVQNQPNFNATLKVWKRTNSVDSGRHTLIDHATMQEIGTFNITGNPITPGVEAQIRGLLGP
jgi:hypothetical protein